MPKYSLNVCWVDYQFVFCGTSKDPIFTFFCYTVTPIPQFSKIDVVVPVPLHVICIRQCTGDLAQPK